VAEACEYARQVALGLAHAHAMGIIHRDVKPSNIVVAGERHLPDAAGPARVKILDFGLARATHPSDQSGPNLTRDYSIVGTPDYIAPEQAKDSKRADARCDLYSLGCTMYFLLTGRVPFPQEGALHKIVAHQTEVAAPVQALRPEVPATVAQLVAQLMAKRPEDRIQTAEELAAVLEPFCDHAPPTTNEPERAARIGHGAQSTRGGAIAEALPFALEDDPTEPDQESKPAPVSAARTEYALLPNTPAPKTKPAATKTNPARRRTELAAPRKLPQFVWVVVALIGVAVLALMLWLVSHQGA
jgi:serine/threonine-protein kinase